MIETVTIRSAQFEVCECNLCGIVYAMPKSLRDWHRKAGGFASCPNGHQWGWSKEDSEDDKIRRERDCLKQETAQLQDAVAAEKKKREAAEKEADLAIRCQQDEMIEHHKTRKKLVSLKKRTAAGTCPCCNRSFSALERHIAAMHPTFRAEDAARENVVSLVKSKSA
jgi:hypothetical protein